MKVTLLGTGTPIPEPERRGPATLVEAGGELVLVDAGSGVVHRLLEAGHQRPRISRLVLTHLHSDHTVGLVDLLWTGWIMSWWREPPLIAGPPGTAEFLRRLQHAFEYDISVREKADRLGAPWIAPVVEEVEQGWAVDCDGYRLSAFRVDHSPVDQAFGFRIDTERSSVAFSGDTKPVDSLVEAAQDVDLLVHEVYSTRRGFERLEELRAAGRDSGFWVTHYHTGSKEVGAVAAAANARHLVLNHNLLWGASPEEVESDVASSYAGNITVGSDLQSFVLP